MRDPRPLVLLCRPTPLLQFLHDARQQLLRAAALVHDTRKLPPLTQLVQPGGVLDVSATHARALQTTADELFGANDSLRWQRVQLFNVPDALDVLSTGEPSPPHSPLQGSACCATVEWMNPPVPQHSSSAAASRGLAGWLVASLTVSWCVLTMHAPLLQCNW